MTSAEDRISESDEDRLRCRLGEVLHQAREVLVSRSERESGARTAELVAEAERLIAVLRALPAASDDAIMVADAAHDAVRLLVEHAMTGMPADAA